MKNFIKSLLLVVISAILLFGCSKGDTDDDKVTLEFFSVKAENIGIYHELIEQFEEEHPNIQVKLEQPPEAETVLRMRLTKNDIPDIIGFNGNPTYGEIAEVGVLYDYSDLDLVDSVDPKYVDMLDRLVGPERDGVFGLPYATNADVVIYNKEKFEELGMEVPKTWDEFIDCLEIAKEAGETPIEYTLLEPWTTLPVWNTLTANLVSEEFGEQMDAGETSFEETHEEAADKMLTLLQYGHKDNFGIDYNDGNSAFASGDGVFYLQINSAVPEIKRINPDIELGTFPLPVTNDPEENKLVSGVDVALSISKDSEHKEEALQFIEFLMEKDTAQAYIEDQEAFSAIKGVTQDNPIYDGINDNFEDGRLVSFQDHYYPIGLSPENMIQDFLIQQDNEKFLRKLDKEWKKVMDR